MKEHKKYFFGWCNLKRLIIELLKIGSNRPSFFSQKRIHQGIAFGVLQWGMIYWLLNKSSVMSTTDFLIWCGVEMAICGYVISQIQKEKFTDKVLKDENPTNNIEP